MNWPAWYEIRLAESLDDRWRQWFLDLGLAWAVQNACLDSLRPVDEGFLEFRTTCGGSKLQIHTFQTPPPGTLLRGELRDPSALFAALARVRDLNLTLLEVRRINPPTGY